MGQAQGTQGKEEPHSVPTTHPLETSAAPFSRLSFQAARALGSTGTWRPALEFIHCTGPHKTSETSVKVRWYAGDATAARKRWAVILAALWNEGVSSTAARVPFAGAKPVHHPEGRGLEHGWEYPLPAEGQPGLADFSKRFIKLQLFPGTREIFLFRKDGTSFDATVCREADDARGFGKGDETWDCAQAWLRLAKQMVVAAPFSFAKYVTNKHLLAFVKAAEKERTIAFAKTSTDPPSRFYQRLKEERRVATAARAVVPPLDEDAHSSGSAEPDYSSIGAAIAVPYKPEMDEPSDPSAVWYATPDFRSNHHAFVHAYRSPAS